MKRQRTNVCHDCGRSRPWLHFHHIVPKSQGGSDDPENLIEICANCHEDRHGGPYGGLQGGSRMAHTPEAIAKRRASLLRRWQDPEYRAKHVAAMREGIKKRDNVALAEKLRTIWTPEKRAAHGAHISGIRKANPWASRGKNVDPNGPTTRRRWSSRFKWCIVCHSIDRKHRGHGLCQVCYARKHKQESQDRARIKREAALREREAAVKIS